MTFQEKVQRWSIADNMDSNEAADVGLIGNINPGAPLDPALGEIDTARINFAVATTSFSWLLKTVTNRLQLDYGTADVLDSVHKLALTWLGRQRGSRALRSQQVGIRMVWDPRVFVQQQEYDGAPSLLNCITITGAAERAQLLLCRDYLNQVWPLTGEAVLEAIITLAAADNATEYVTTSLFDGLRLTIQLTDGGIQGELVGLFDSIVEVLQILAWLGCALKESSSPMMRCGITTIQMDHKAPQVDSSPQFLLKFFEDGFSTPDASGSFNGGCWLSGFLNNPVIAKGFPILHRPVEAMGLDTPLDIMALLIGAPCLTVFGNRAMVKGFNAAVIPTVYSEDHIQWHFVLDGNGNRLRYSDERMESSPQVVMAEMTTLMSKSRHFLGWTTTAAYHIGSPSANYNIGWSSPEFVGPGCALEKVIISGGAGFLSLGAECSIGRKDRSPMIKRHTSYFESLSGLSSSYVVLYDIQDRRAWLSNGVHTLLHLVRASLKEDQKGDFSDECLLNHLSLGEAVDDAEATSPKAAIRFLKNRQNLEQPVFPGLDDVYTEQTTVAGGQTTTTHHRTNTTVRLKDRVNQIMEMLWQIIDHQATLEAFTSAVPVRLPRNKLEGYRFMEFATRRAMTPRVAYLQTFNGAGKSWVDFVRALRAVVLFGEGFGELIAAKDNTLCSRWNTVPTSKDYLTVGGFDLARILHQEGSAHSNPMKLAPGIYWDPSTPAFEPCTCDGHTGPALLRRRCDRVQVLLPGKLARISGTKAAPNRVSVDENCAIIFGKSDTFPWRWPDLGDPKPEDPKLEDDSEAAARSENPAAAGLSGLSSPNPSTISPSQGGSPIATSSTTPTTAMSPMSTQDELGEEAASSTTESSQRRKNFRRGPRNMWKSLRKG